MQRTERSRRAHECDPRARPRFWHDILPIFVVMPWAKPIWAIGASILTRTLTSPIEVAVMFQDA